MAIVRDLVRDGRSVGVRQDAAALGRRRQANAERICQGPVGFEGQMESLFEWLSVLSSPGAVAWHCRSDSIWRVNS